jgi:spore photoproduct lyase
MQQLAERGWLLGLRFDPILYRPKWQQEYSSFFKEVFAKIPIAAVHSATLGSLRMPKPIYKNMKGLYPRESLFSLPFAKQKDTYGYPSDLDQQMQTFCLGLLESSLPSERIFPMVA